MNMVLKSLGLTMGMLVAFSAMDAFDRMGRCNCNKRRSRARRR